MDLVILQGCISGSAGEDFQFIQGALVSWRGESQEKTEHPFEIGGSIP
jgi:hypothetical protein